MPQPTKPSTSLVVAQLPPAVHYTHENLVGRQSYIPGQGVVHYPEPMMQELPFHLQSQPECASQLARSLKPEHRREQSQ